MTVATTQISEVWTGDASSVTFPIPFPFLSRDHLVVWKEGAGGAQTTMTISTATGEGEPSGGSITLTDPVGVGYTLRVRRNTPKTQETDYVPHDPFPADSHERALDKLTMIVQELIAAGAIDLDVDTLRGLIGDSSTIVWTLSPDGTKTIASVVDAGMAKNEAGGVSRYHGDLHSNDLDILFRVNPDTGKLDSVMYQGTGLGARLLQVKTDFEFAGWADGYLYGGRGIAAGYAWVGEVGSQEHVRVWRCNDAAAHMYQTRDNWATSVHDTSAVALLVGVRPPCLAYIEISGVSCWVLTSASGGHWWYAQDIAANYNADGTLKAAAWNAGANMAPHQIADIAESPDGGFRLVGNHNYIMKTTDWVTFTDVYNAGTILGGIDTDKAGKWVAVDRDAGGIAMSIDDGDTWSWPTTYKRNGEDGEYVAAGNILPSGCVAYANGRWLITSSYNAGYAYSEDGIYWTVFDSPLGEFYGVASDGVRVYATNPTKVGTGAQNVVYRLLVSEIPFHRHTVHEKGATVDGGLWISDIPSADMVATDALGRAIRRRVTISTSAPMDPPTAMDAIWYVVPA